MTRKHTKNSLRSDVKNVLLDVYKRLHDHFGAQNWWPGESPFEIAIGAILTQSTNWKNVEKAIQSLKDADALSPKALRGISEKDLARLIYSSGFHNTKARKIKTFVKFLWERFNGDINALQHEDANFLRNELLSVHGIGPETADDILLYIAHKPSFVADAYTRRIIYRLGISPIPKTYESYRSLFHDNLPCDETLFSEYHALLVRLGKEVCRPKPNCGQCCLLPICETGQGLSLPHLPSAH